MKKKGGKAGEGKRKTKRGGEKTISKGRITNPRKRGEANPGGVQFPGGPKKKGEVERSLMTLLSAQKKEKRKGGYGGRRMGLVVFKVGKRCRRDQGRSHRRCKRTGSGGRQLKIKKRKKKRGGRTGPTKEKRYGLPFTRVHGEGTARKPSATMKQRRH